MPTDEFSASTVASSSTIDSYRTMRVDVPIYLTKATLRLRILTMILKTPGSPNLTSKNGKVQL